MTPLSWLAATLGALLTGPAPTPAAPRTETKPPVMRISPQALATAATMKRNAPPPLYTTTARDAADLARTFAPAKPPPGVVPEGAAMAMDESVFGDQFAFAAFGSFAENLSWLGYPYLAELAQRPEYRRITETLAKDMTRRWIRVQASGSDGDKSEKIKTIEAELRRHKIQAKFRRLAELDGYFGRGHLYIDTGKTGDREELKLPLTLTKAKVGRTLRGFRVVEPTWTYPGQYNSTDPLDEDYYVPRTWYVMAKEVHRTRLLTFVGREMPDLLKPAYAFGGLSMSQMAKPYVDNWLRTRQSVSDLIHSFSTPVLMTDMGAMLTGGDGVAVQGAMDRVQLFNMLRDNAGLFEIDKTKEDFKNVATPLGTLDHLQAQAQEHMASVSGEPLVILTGITPSGLNATSEGELQVWAQTVRSMQEHLFSPRLTVVLHLIQLDKFGEIDEDITFDYEPLKEESESEGATARKTDADSHAVYVNAGVLDPAEVRQVLASQDDSPYSGLDLSGPPPTPPDQEEDPLAGGEGREDGGGQGGGAPATDTLRAHVDWGGELVDRHRNPNRLDVTDVDLATDEDSPPVRRLQFGNIRIGIETPRGEERVGRNWRCVMPCDYGYIMRTEGRDGDRVDVFVGPLAPEQLPVHVVEQVKLPSGGFDEHKVLIGFETRADAVAAYDGSFSDGSGPRRRGRVWQMPWGELRGWLTTVSREPIPKTEVEYHLTDGPDHCGVCDHFLAPNACALVAGAVENDGWCKKFEKEA